MAVSVDDLVIRATLANEVAPGAAAVRAEVGAIGAEVKKLDAQAIVAGGGSAGLARVESRLGTVATAGATMGGRLRELGDSVFDRVTEGAKRLAEALGLVQTGIAAIGVESALQVSRTETSLQTYLGVSTGAAKRTTDQLRNMALGSMNVGVLSGTLNQFLAGGMDVGPAMGLLRGVQNIAAAQPGNQGAALTGMTSALGQVIGSQEITGRQLRGFAPYFDVYGLLSQQLGVPRSYVRDMLQSDAPAIGTQQFLSALTNLNVGPLTRYQGALGRYKASPAGQVQEAAHNIEEQADTHIGQPILTYLGSNLMPKVNTFLGRMDWGKVDQGASRLAHSLGQSLSPAWASVQRDAGPFVHALERMAPMIPAIVGDIANLAAGVFHAATVVLGFVGPPLTGLVVGLSWVFTHGGPLKDIVGGLVGAFVGLAILAKVQTWVSELVGPVVNLTKALLGLDAAEAGGGGRAAGVAAGAEEAVAADAGAAEAGAGALATRAGSGRLGAVLRGAAPAAIGMAAAGPVGNQAAKLGRTAAQRAGLQQAGADVTRGAGIGATAGSAIPVVGTIVGGLLGAIGGGAWALTHQHHDQPAQGHVIQVDARGATDPAATGAAAKRGVTAALSAADAQARDRQERR